MVTLRSRVFASDEELAKRNDDYKSNGNMAPWQVRHRPLKRILIVIGACLGIWLFIHYIPTDLGPKDSGRRPRYRDPIQQRPRVPITKPDFKYTQEKARDVPEVPAIPRAQRQAVAVEDGPPALNYDGPVRFYALASSLHAVKNIVDYRPGNRHVLFAASDLRSLSSLMPIACEMANWKRNHVHVAIMGRDEMSVEDIQLINGASFRDCPVYFHDARPDMASISTDPRMQLSVSGALGHINTYMLPRAIITTTSDNEDVFFTVGVSRTAKALGITHISVPKNAPEKLSWMARLDASSLNSWFSATFDILIQAPLQSAGTLIRLLTSLERADYTGFQPPRLIIELPHEIGTATQNYLTRFKWPPVGTTGHQFSDQLLIRRRISEQHIPVEEASRRFMESFYPSSPRGPHVLVLSPQAEVSPAFFHYLKLHLLEFRHSYEGRVPARDMLGISLETPSLHLNASAEFSIPRVWERSNHHESEEAPVFEPFCWQAPNSNAALYFADKWIELHHFLTKRRTASLHPLTESHHSKRLARVAQIYPSWLEYTLDLMRLRGYYFHYPGVFHRIPSSDTESSSSFSTSEESLVIIHNELYHPPEEFAHPIAARADDPSTTATTPSLPSSTILEVDPNSDYLATHHPAEGVSHTLNDERPLVRKLDPILPPLTLILKDDPMNPTEPGSEPLPPLNHMALLEYTGEELSPEELARTATALRKGYRHFAGGCTEEEAKRENRELGTAADLFCFDDKDVDTSMLLTPSEPEDTISPETKRTSSDPNARKQPAPAAKNPEHANPANPKPTSTRIHGSEGAAAGINRVQDAAKYEETAKAKFLQKTADKDKKYEYLPVLDTKELMLTDEEKAYLAEQEKDKASRQKAGEAAAKVLGDAGENDDNSIPRDAPPVPDADALPPGTNFEEQMAQRDAQKKVNLGDRARAAGPQPVNEFVNIGEGGVAKGRLPVIENVEGARAAGPGARRAGDGPAKGRIPVMIPEAEDAQLMPPSRRARGGQGGGVNGFEETERDTVGDMHPADVEEEERRFVVRNGEGDVED